MKITYYPLKEIPRIQIKEPPRLKQKEKKYLQEAEKEILLHPYFFNGPTLHVLQAKPEYIKLFPATYAWNLAQKNLPGEGGLGISLLLQKEDGSYLWQERSHRVILPHLWDFSVGGTATQENLESEIRKEALEELGQSELLDLKVEGLSIISNYKVDLLFSAKWSKEPLLINEEIKGLHWGPEAPRPSLRGTRLLFRAFKERNQGKKPG